MKITILSTYPAEPARHGGQHRIANILATLRAAGHEVSSVGILGSDNYAATSGFLPFPGYQKLRSYIDNPFLMEDFAIGKLAAGDTMTFEALARLIDKQADVLFCEQPWLFEFARKYREKSKNRKLKLFFDSQNVESDLKREIVSSYYGTAYAETCEKLILDVELAAISNADAIATVSKADAEWTKRFSRVPVAVAPNGVRSERASVSDVVAANAIARHEKYALYVASAHPPNIFGFYDQFGGGIGCFNPNHRLIVAGSAGDAISGDERFGKVAGLAKSFINAGSVSDAALRGLLQTAHCIFLPMTSGGGTNLKTAEALWSGRAVVATTHAMRGFEQYERSPGVHVARSKGEFLSTIRDCMQATRFNIDQAERNQRKSLLWDETLKPLVATLDERMN